MAARKSTSGAVKLTAEQARSQALEGMRVAAVAADTGDRADAVSLLGAGIRRKASLGERFYEGYKLIAGASGATLVAANHDDAFATVATAWGLKRVGKGLEIPGAKARSWSTLSEDWTCWRNVSHIDDAVRVVDEAGQPIDTKHVIPALRLFGKGNKRDAVAAAIVVKNPTADTADGGTTTRHTVAAAMGAAIVNKSTLDAVLSPVAAEHVKVRDAARKGLGGLLDIVRDESFRNALAGATVTELRLLARIVDGAITERVKLDKLTPAAPTADAAPAADAAEAVADTPAEPAPTASDDDMAEQFRQFQAFRAMMAAQA
jgi:hypothetical protein